MRECRREPWDDCDRLLDDELDVRPADDADPNADANQSPDVLSLLCYLFLVGAGLILLLWRVGGR